MPEEVIPRQPDEEIFRWHGALFPSDEARGALVELAAAEGMTYEEILEELQRRRYRHSQVGWPRMIGQKPYEKLPDWMGDSLTTPIVLPSGKKLALTTHLGRARVTEIELRDR